MNEEKSLISNISGLYWRRSAWNGAKTVPAILELHEGVLSAKTEYTAIFSLPIEQVSVRFTRWGTMIIAVENKKYAFTPVGSGTSREFSADMATELNQKSELFRKNPGPIGTPISRAAMATGSPVATVAGAATMTASYLSGLGPFTEWQQIFSQVNVLSDKSAKNFRKSTILSLVVIVIVVMIASLVYLSLTT